MQLIISIAVVVVLMSRSVGTIIILPTTTHRCRGRRVQLIPGAPTTTSNNQTTYRGGTTIAKSTPKPLFRFGRWWCWWCRWCTTTTTNNFNPLLKFIGRTDTAPSSSTFPTGWYIVAIINNIYTSSSSKLSNTTNAIIF